LRLAEYLIGFLELEHLDTRDHWFDVNIRRMVFSFLIRNCSFGDLKNVEECIGIAGHEVVMNRRAFAQDIHGDQYVALIANQVKGNRVNATAIDQHLVANYDRFEYARQAKAGRDSGSNTTSSRSQKSAATTCMGRLSSSNVLTCNRFSNSVRNPSACNK
jgi:hypothetical protein